MGLSRKTYALLVGCFLVLVAGYMLFPKDRPSEIYTLDPTMWFAPQWTDLLGGDALTPQEALLDLDALRQATDLDSTDIPGVSKLMFDLTMSAASGADQGRFGDYFARNHPQLSAPQAGLGSFCTDVSVEAVSTFTLPVSPIGSFVKSLVVWSGSCPNPPPSLNGPVGKPLFVSFLYAARSEMLPYDTANLASSFGGWVPVRPVEVPGARFDAASAASLPSPWETTTLTECSLSDVQVRLEVAAAFAQLCSAAEGVPLVAVEGLRTPEEQQTRFDDARDSYGSEQAARSRVAFSDGFLCESLHCAGEAIDLAPNESVLEWLQATTACLSGSSVSEPPCAETSRPVSRLERYGFVAPHPKQPFHIEYALGTFDADAEIYGDCTPGGVQVPERIVYIFKCRIMESGFGPTTPQSVLDEALEIARCTSGFDPGFSSFGGRYRNSPNPATGSTDDRIGIFGLSKSVSARWIPTPYQASSATANIDAAARIYVEERTWGRRGWGPFACAAADDGIVSASVLSD